MFVGWNNGRIENERIHTKMNFITIEMKYGSQQLNDGIGKEGEKIKVKIECKDQKRITEEYQSHKKGDYRDRIKTSGEFMIFD